MTWRIASFTLLLALGGIAGVWMAGHWGAALGAGLAGITWFVLDLLRALRVLRWLRRPGSGDAPRMSGVWGEVADRVRRALRTREQETRQAQLRLQEFLSAIQASPNGVILLDRAGHIEWCNQTAAAHLGIDVQRDLMQLIGNLLRDPAFTAYWASGDFDRDVVITGRGSLPSRPTRVSLRLHPYGEGRSLLLSRDVTALELAETMRRDFVANVSHEIRTPLTVLAGFVETLQNLPLPETDRAHYLGLMAQQAQRMQSLVNDLLTLSRLEGSPTPGTGEWTRLHKLMSRCESDAQALSELLDKHHRLVFDAPPDADVAGSSSELLSAMFNLVSNAIRYTPDGQAIHVRWQLDAQGDLEFSVQDTGTGIAPEHLPRLTERFYRIDRSRSRDTGGTGLGLAIVKHVVQRHGGDVRITSTLGVGSRFAFVLPAQRVRQLSGSDAQPATAA